MWYYLEWRNIGNRNNAFPPFLYGHHLSLRAALETKRIYGSSYIDSYRIGSSKLWNLSYFIFGTLFQVHFIIIK